MKKSFIFTLFIFVAIIFTMLSCEQPNNEIPVQEYSTPTIKGTVSIPEGKNVNPGDIYVKVIDSNDKTVTVQKVNPDKTFVVQGLNAEMKYSILFTSVEPDFANRGASRAAEKSNGVGGWIHAIQPAIKEGNDVGNVKMKPLGTIRGKALIDGKSEHYDTTVYIPGTSYIAMTNSDGTYAIYNVPEGTYTLRYTHDGYMPMMTEGVILTCPEDAENPETTTRDVRLISSEGTVEGVAKLGDVNDSSVVSVRLENEDKSIVYSSTSSKEGYYVINNVTPGKYRIIASASGYISQTSQYFTVAPATLIRVQEDILLFGNIGTVKGSAFLSDSDVKSGLSILIKDINSKNSFSTLTDDNGLFQKALKPGEYRISANYPGYTPVSHDIVISENNTTEVNFPALLPNSGTIAGYSNSVEEQVTVMAQDGTPVSTILSGLDKSYRFERIPTGTYSVKFSKAGFASYIVNDVNVAPAGTVTVNGEPLKSAYGTIRGTSAGAEESVSLIKDGAVIETVTVNASKQYIFTGIAPGTYSVKFSRDGYTSYESDLISLVAGSEITINGKTLISIHGSVRGLSSSSGETVSLIKNGTVLKTVVTSHDRSFRFELVEPGTYSVRFSREGYTPYDSEGVTVSAGTEAIVNGNTLVSKFGTIKGVSSSSGETVYLVRNGVQIQSATTLEGRGYIFSGITTGEYSVRFTKSGYKAYESDVVTVVAGESYVVDGQKLVSSYGAVAGFVFLSGSDDYSGVTVTLTNSESITSSLVAITASDGSFRITDIKEAGTYLLTYSKEGYVTENTKSVDVTIGSVANAGSVTLKSTCATVKGTIQLEGASSYENVTILLKNDNNQYTSTTDQKGGYLINRVLPGTYTLLASKDGYVTSTPVEVVIEPSSEKAVETKSLAVAIRSVTGSVTLELLSDYSGALVTATNLSDNTLVYSAITNSSGDFTLAGMKPGEYSVVISCNGYRSVTLPTINIVSSSTTNLPVTNMLVNRGTVSGTVTLEGRSSSSGIKVELLRGSEVYAESTTDESGNYSFYVPQGNYSGVRYSKTDFASVSVSRNIALFADNYVSMGDTVLKATHNTVNGRVDVLTTDNEGNVTISFDGITSIPAVTTSANGEFSFDHIPVGNYVMRFRKTYCSDITVPVEVKAADVIDLGIVTIKPSTATIKGTVVLKDGLSSSGVTVSIDMGGKTLQTTTDSSGRYEIGGVSIAEEYTVTYSKNGWNSKTQIISPKLELLEIREMPEMTLVDTTSPVLKSVTINNGANTAADKNVKLHIDAEDSGSGISNMLVYDYYNPQYLGTFSSLKDWTFESQNGSKTVYVKVIDRAGNESNIVSAQITLTDQKKEVKGVLKGEDLTWTKEMSPYLVTGNLLVEKDDTLTIEPGVDVQFSGDYYLQVEGKLSAIGTEGERISIYGIDGGANNWYGMKFINNNDSKLSNVEISGLKNGITGYCDIDHALITANGWAVGITSDYDPEDCLRGSLTNSTVKGSVSVAYDYVIDNSINGSIYVYSSNIDGNTFSGSKLDTRYSFVYNNEVSSTNVYSYSDIQKYVTYNGCTLYLGYYLSSSTIMTLSALYNIQFNNCSFPRFAADIKESNFHNCGPITVVSDRSTQEKYICTDNYWGDINTVEIKRKGEGQNLSFITDNYDNFNKSRIDYNRYKESTIVNAGYHGEEPDGKYSGYSIGDTGPAGGIVFYDKGFYSDGWRYLEAATSDIGIYAFGYYRPDGTNNNIVGTAHAIGSGRYNTERLVECMDIDGKAYSNYSGETTYSEYAAKKCLDYIYGRYDDWFLPSKDELNLMYHNLHKQGFGSFADYNYYYWSSSEDSSSNAWSQFFYNGLQRSQSRRIDYVRAVRAF